MVGPLIEIAGLTRQFVTGGETIAALKTIDLSIEAGEFIAIVGQSGSGKSTLMNVLGCLDNEWTGTYRLAGRDVARLRPDQLAELRREHFGFIFQRYQLLSDLDALENVEIPAIYAGAQRGARRERALMLLGRLGLADRLTHRPSELSGGQQQRVSIARALINGGEIILADEPTGALDSRSGKELLTLLKELHAEGHTVIMVTHDQAIAAFADRSIELKDGEIVADRRNAGALRHQRTAGPIRHIPAWRQMLDRSAEALGMAIRALSSHRLRTFLTMLGIIIGIASVVSVVALGQGGQQQVLDRISSIGTNTINILPGASAADRRAGAIRTLTPADASALAAEAFADSVTPQVQSNATVRYGSVAANAQVVGAGPDVFRVGNRSFVSGVSFDQSGIDGLAQEAVIDSRARDTLFPDGEEALGRVILVGKVPLRVIGIIAASTNNFGPGSNSIGVWVPYTTAMSRLLGQSWLNSITVRIADTADVDTAQSDIQDLLLARHGGTADFSLQNTDTIRETIQATSQTLSLLISAIAVISLIVGGIGVMNIMLVSVRERTREIGVRMAVGARQGDIMQQFLIEAVLVCLIGGATGIALSLAIGFGIDRFAPGLRMIYSPVTIALAFAASTAIGIGFGFMPARTAARLDPVVALATE
ncbi:MAG: MacB family efflux pump subunit [Devosia sp.]